MRHALFQGIPVNRLRQEMDRVVNEVVMPMARDVDAWLATGTVGPKLNVWEENDVFYAEAEVPGLQQDDLDVSVVGNQLTIQGRRTASMGESPVFHRRERSFGEFSRSVTLPVEVDAEHVSATLTNGVLTVSMPKAEKAKPRKIAIQS